MSISTVLYSNKNSTIFTTIDGSVDKTKKTLALFNKDWNTYKTNWQQGVSQGGIVGGIKSIFQSGSSASTLSNDSVQILRNWNNAVKHGCSNQETFNKIIANADDNTKMYFAGLNKGKGSIEGLKSAQNAAKQSTLSLTIAQTALNAVVNMGIGLIISYAMQSISKLINYQQDLINKSQEAISAFEDSRNSLISNKQTITEISSDYTRLAQGVDNLGRNVSLNTEEYARYNEIVNQIATMFPQMIQGYTDEGNAIITNKGNVKELIKAYEEEKQAYQDLVITKSADTFDGYKAKVSVAPWTETLKGTNGTYAYMQQKKYIDELIKSLEDGKQAFKDFYDEKYIGNSGIYNILGSATKTAGVDWGGLMTDDERYVHMKEIQMSKLYSYQRQLVSNINAETAKIKPIMTAYLEQSYDYQSLDSDVQDTIKQIVGQFNSDFYAQFDNETEMVTWVTDNIVNEFQGEDGKKLSTELQMMLGIQTQFNDGEITVTEYQEKLNSFLEFIGKLPEDTQKAIKLVFGINIDDTGKASSNLDTMISNVKEKLKKGDEDKVGTLTLEDLEIAYDKLKIDPKVPISWEELTNKIQEYKDTQSDIDKTTTSLSSLKNSSAGITSLTKALKELDDNGYITTDTITSIKEAVGDSISNWDEYQHKLLTTAKGSDEFNQILGDLTYAILENKLGVKNLADADQDYIKAVLRENGVMNASTVAHNMIEKAKAKEYIQTKENIGVKESETKVTANNISKLIQNANAAGIAKNAYIELKAKEILFGNNSFSTQSKCAQLLELAKSAGIATVAMSALESEVNAAYDRKNGMTRKEYAESKGIKVLTEKERIQNGDKAAKGKGSLYVVGNQEFEGLKEAVYQKEINDTMDRMSGTFANLNPVDYLGGTVSDSPSQKETKETFNWIETALSRIQRKITNFGKTVSATWKSWTDRTNALNNQISSVNRELELQTQARARYEQQANSVALDENTKRLVREGAIDITTVDDNTAELIKEYQDWYEKILECDDAVIDLKDDLADLAQTKFDNLSKQFEDQAAFIDHEASMLEATADLLETRGYIASKSVYNSLIQNTQSKKDILQSQRSALMDNLNNSGIEKGTEAWNKMYLEILDLDKEILKLDNDTADYQNRLRELDWEVFDIIQEKISGITDETEFLIDMIINKINNYYH